MIAYLLLLWVGATLEAPVWYWMLWSIGAFVQVLRAIINVFD